MIRNDISILLVVIMAISYLAISPETAKAGIILEEDGIIDACVANRSGYTRILDPFSRSTRCKFWENPVSWNQDGGGNSDGIMVVTDSTDYTNICGSELESFSFSIDCPEGKFLIGGDCTVEPAIQDTDLPSGNAAGKAIPNITNSDVSSFSKFPPQSWECSIGCGISIQNTISGTLTATALCVEAPEP